MLHRYVVNDQGGSGKTLFQFDGDARGEGELPEIGFTVIITNLLRLNLGLTSRYCKVLHTEIYRQGGVSEILRKVYTATGTDLGFPDPLTGQSQYYLNGTVVHTEPLSEDRISMRVAKLMPFASNSSSSNPRDWTMTLWLPNPFNTCRATHVYEWRDDQGNITSRRTEIVKL